MAYQRIGALKSVEAFREYLSSLGVELAVDEAPLSAEEDSPLAKPINVGEFTVGNRWAVHPMEGWDGTDDGMPTEHTIRRWQHFGESGCKLIWGGEAFAVRRDGRANPNQLYYNEENEAGIQQLHEELLEAHRNRFGNNADSDFLVGLQLTHSGRFCRPNDKSKLEPRIAYHHPLLDKKFNIAPDDDSVLLTDDDIKRLIDDYVTAAKMAVRIGFGFVDVKHCHGYLGHEFLSAYTRPGPYGGNFEGRTRFLTEIVEGIKSECPELMIGVRLSLFDMPPFHPDGTQSSGGKLGPGIPDDFESDYPGFGCDRENPLRIELAESIKLLEYMRDDLGIAMVNVTAGSPYYNPHIQRPAFYPPSDGYQPPEDPLIGCVRQIEAVRQVKKAIPDLPIVGSAYSYFQEFLPHIAQPLVRDDAVDFVGIGRLVLSYWDMPADILAGKDVMSSKKICRTFSDCTTGPRNGLISGCFPLDEYYKSSPVHQELKDAKKALRERLKT